MTPQRRPTDNELKLHIYKDKIGRIPAGPGIPRGAITTGVSQLAHMKMGGHGEEVHVQLEVESDGAVETHFNSHLLKDALANLIEEASIDFWMKGDGELKPEEFWRAMLGAVARNYRASQDVPIVENAGNAAVRRELIDLLEREEYL